VRESREGNPTPSLGHVFGIRQESLGQAPHAAPRSIPMLGRCVRPERHNLLAERSLRSDPSRSASRSVASGRAGHGGRSDLAGGGSDHADLIIGT